MIPQINLSKIKWYWIVIPILLITIFFLFNQTEKLSSDVATATEKAKEHEIKAKFYLDTYYLELQKDSALQVKYDSLLLKKNKIKIQYNEKIKIINQYSVSDMQRYFDERTK